MYQKVGIQKLSKAQISKLVNGHRVRVKHGNAHEISVSKEQHKKLMSAHKKGCGITIQSDPYQTQLLNHELRGKAGKGFMEDLKSVGNTLTPVAVDIGSALLKKKLGLGKKKGEGIMDDLKSVGTTLAPIAVDIGTQLIKKKLGLGKNGGALFPAGYGLSDKPKRKQKSKKSKAKRTKKGKGVIGKVLGSALGGIAGGFLPF
jgi:hypothetical protein